MTKDKKLEKFSSLSDERITEIVERSKEKPIKDWLIPIAKKTQEMLESEKYSELATYLENDGKVTKEFLNENLELVGEFLKDCRLIGTLNEKSEVGRGSYVIGAEAVSLINEYLATKPNNADAHEVAHEVVVVRNKDFYTEDTHSSKTANVMMDKKGVHSSWAERLSEDLTKTKENGEDFNKTYVIETFGSTGGNHFVAVTVRKEANENAPLVDFFDPSPGLLRGSVETFKNSIAVGFAAQIMVDATLTKVFKEQGLEFDSEKYFNNDEPFQMGGSSNCSVFSYEKAYMNASLSREEHEKLLKDHYRFDNPFGGKGDVKINLEAVFESNSGKVDNARFALPPQYSVMSHFSGNTKQYYENGRMESVNHKRKRGEEETVKERYDRYTEEDENGNRVRNSLIDQKMLRQKYGHLLEIVTSSQFLEMMQMQTANEIPAVPAFANSAYSPEYSASEMPENEQVKNLVKGRKASEEEKNQGVRDIVGLNDIMPFPIKIVSASYDEATNLCSATLYVSDRLRQRLEAFARENNFGMEAKTENFDEKGFDLSKINPILRNREKVTLQIPLTEESFKKIADTDKTRFTPTPLTRVAMADAVQIVTPQQQIE